MKDEYSHIMTPFDQYISTQPMQMTKLLIPFLPPQTQRTLAVYVKFLEFRHTFSTFRNMRQQEKTPEDMLNSMRPYMSSSDADSLDQMMNMMSMMSMMQEMQNMSDSEFDPMSMMSGIFVPENSNEPQKEGDTDE